MNKPNYAEYRDGKNQKWSPEVMQMAQVTDNIDGTIDDERHKMRGTFNAPHLQH